MYKKPLANLKKEIAFVENSHVYSPAHGGRLILQQGHVVDPANSLDAVGDIAVQDGCIAEVAQQIPAEKGDQVICCDGLLVVPGLIDMHLHINDLFEVSTQSGFCAAEDGVTTALSPGAGNTFMAPALLGAEIDRGMPLNAGVYLGGASVLGSMLDTDELVSLFNGTLPSEIAAKKMTRNVITNQTAPLVMGIKDHMGHFLMSGENIDRLFEITTRAGLVYMSHTQDIEHTLRMADLSKGRCFHLGHATAAGGGQEPQAAENMQAVVTLCRQAHISGEFVSTMLRKGLGSREGMQISPRAQQIAYDAMADGTVKILVSDGQNQSTMKGFGDTRDNIPAMLELAEQGVLDLSGAIATMTCNPARQLAVYTRNPWWAEKNGNLSVGTPANITIIDRLDRMATYTIVNGQIVSFENRIVRRGLGAGQWVCKFGAVKNTGVGEISMLTRG